MMELIKKIICKIKCVFVPCCKDNKKLISCLCDNKK